MFTVRVISNWINPQDHSFSTKERADAFAKEMKEYQYFVEKLYDA